MSEPATPVPRPPPLGDLGRRPHVPHRGDELLHGDGAASAAASTPRRARCGPPRSFWRGQATGAVLPGRQRACAYTTLSSARSLTNSCATRRRLSAVCITATVWAKSFEEPLERTRPAGSGTHDVALGVSAGSGWPTRRRARGRSAAAGRRPDGRGATPWGRRAGSPHRRSWTAQYSLRWSGPNACGSTAVIGRMPSGVSSISSGPPCSQSRLAAAAARHQHRAVTVDTGEGDQPATATRRQRRDQPALGTQRDPVRGVLHVAAGDHPSVVDQRGRAHRVARVRDVRVRDHAPGRLAKPVPVDLRGALAHNPPPTRPGTHVHVSFGSDTHAAKWVSPTQPTCT